jgi:hypothetical protein
MPPQSKRSYKIDDDHEARIQAAINELNQGILPSVRAAARIHNVRPFSTSLFQLNFYLCSRSLARP